MPWTHLVPRPGVPAEVTPRSAPLVLLERGVYQDDVKLAVQLVQIKHFQVTFEIPATNSDDLLRFLRLVFIDIFYNSAFVWGNNEKLSWMIVNFTFNNKYNLSFEYDILVRPLFEPWQEFAKSM